jgi:hypothetical protein
VLHLHHGQHRVSLRVDTTVSHIHAPIAEQVLKQQAADRGEGPLDRLVVGWAQHPCRQDVDPHGPLGLDQVVVCRPRRGW